MSNATVTTNDIKPGTQVTMVGELDEFTYYLNHLLEGEKLQETVNRQKAAGWKYPNTKERSEFRIVDPRPEEGTNKDDPEIKKLLTYLKEKKVYTNKEGVTSLECVKSGRVPLMGVKQPNGRIAEIRPTGMLEAGQTVMVTFQCYGTDKGNNGISVNTVVFLEEPKMKQALEGWDRIDSENQSAQAPAPTPTPAQAQAQAPAPASAPAQAPEVAPAPAQAPETSGFVPVSSDEEIPW